MAKVVKRQDEDIEQLLRRFKKQVMNEGIMEELRRREYYVAPSRKRKLKSIEAQKRERRLNKVKNNYKHSEGGYDY